MTRFVITMGQAVRLIETALWARWKGGEIFAVRLRGFPTCSFDSSLPVLPLPSYWLYYPVG